MPGPERPGGTKGSGSGNETHGETLEGAACYLGPMVAAAEPEKRTTAKLDDARTSAVKANHVGGGEPSPPCTHLWRQLYK